MFCTEKFAGAPCHIIGYNPMLIPLASKTSQNDNESIKSGKVLLFMYEDWKETVL